MLELDNLLAPEVLAKAVRVGNEWLVPFQEALKSVSTATANEIAVLGVESFQIETDGCKFIDYSGYQFLMDGDWPTFVTQNNSAAEQYITERPLGEGCGYILTSTSRQQFDELSVPQ